MLLADDGLQHYALQRDVELVVADARGAGNGWLLPAGPLRERWSRRRDATLGDAAVLAALPDDGTPRFALRRRLGVARHLLSGERVELSELQRRHADRALDAAAGIGDPQRFFDHLRDAGVTLGQALALPDHAAFDADPLAALDAPAVLVTEKDALKCEPGQRAFARVWAVDLELDADPAFIPWLLSRCASAVRPKETADGLPPA
ncbi:tetraacyldisaccharide 4'-kinase [mine drainage metagenome]|uniref:tetraacyldisaccharide 4'-kinase n=1 Tax=mine drainage metagenome TaxID=410659 RepID=A0A1J5QL03_9ZZZZ